MISRYSSLELGVAVVEERGDALLVGVGAVRLDLEYDLVVDGVGPLAAEVVVDSLLREADRLGRPVGQRRQEVVDALV